MHNFNYWLQDRDVKYFKEFYLLKGFVFNEQGEPKDVSEPKLDDDGRFWLVPRPGAVPDTDGTFDDKDLIRNTKLLQSLSVSDRINICNCA